MAVFDDYWGIAAALAIGFLLGLERGWRRRDDPEGSRMAGLRTFALFGLVGGVLGLFGREGFEWVLALGVLACGGLLAVGFLRDERHHDDASITTVAAAFLTVLLGALAVWGYPALAFSAAVVAALLLNLKPTLHGFLQRLSAEEVRATIRFLLISAVVLPLLPNQGYGPYQAVNPYVIWWMVVLISGLSFAGYIAVRLFGEKRGLYMTAAFGALVSSTAITIAFSREAKLRSGSAEVLSSAILLASTIMILRVIVVAVVISPSLFQHLTIVLLPMTVVGFVAVLVNNRGVRGPRSPDHKLENPFDLSVALVFAAALALVLLGSHYLEAEFGSKGLLALAWTTGLMDVDAMTISASQMVKQGLGAEVAVTAILCAAIANSITKFTLALLIARNAMPMRFFLGFIAMIGAGIAVFISLNFNFLS